MSSVEKTRYGTWRARWVDDTGKRRAQSFRLKADAVKHLRDIETGARAEPHRSKLSLEAFADEWLAGAMNLRAGARETYRRDLDRYIIPTLGDTRLANLTPTVIDELLAAELARGLAPSSVHRHYRTLHRMLEVAVSRRRLTRNPCADVTPPRIPKSEMRFLTAEQVEALAIAIKPRFRAWVLSAAYLGFRWSEGIGLRRCDIDGANVKITSQLLRRADGRWEREETKTAAGRRTVVAPASIAAVLEQHLEDYVKEPLDALVFATATGRPLIGSKFRSEVFKPAVEKAKLDPAIRVHDLRHTAVALAIAAGAHPKTIQARLGHASISVTLDRYGHLFPGTDGAVADDLDVLRAAVKPKLRAVCTGLVDGGSSPVCYGPFSVSPPA